MKAEGCVDSSFTVTKDCSSLNSFVGNKKGNLFIFYLTTGQLKFPLLNFNTFFIFE